MWGYDRHHREAGPEGQERGPATGSRQERPEGPPRSKSGGKPGQDGGDGVTGTKSQTMKYQGPKPTECPMRRPGQRLASATAKPVWTLGICPSSGRPPPTRRRGVALGTRPQVDREGPNRPQLPPAQCNVLGLDRECWEADPKFWLKWDQASSVHDRNWKSCRISSWVGDQ